MQLKLFHYCNLCYSSVKLQILEVLYCPKAKHLGDSICVCFTFKTLCFPICCFADPAAPSPLPNSFRLPPSAPIHLVCSVDSPTSILLTWQRLMSSERIAYYTVKYYPRGVLRPVHVERKVYSESIIMTGLTPGKEYSISVQSHHEAEANGHPDVSTTHKYCKISLTGMMCNRAYQHL